jgi:methylase of polypeptide subunit release factors
MSSQKLGDAPLSLGSSEELAALRSALLRAEYTAANQDRLVFPAGAPSGAPLEISVALRRIKGDSPRETLLRIFRLRDAVPRDAAGRAFAPLRIEQIASMGLVSLANDRVSSSVSLIEHDGLFFVCDRSRTERDDLAEDYVTGVNATSKALAAITLRHSVDLALDLGTGCGIQALLMARHARHVVATDLNPRALNLTTFNAHLNGFSNVECRRGSLFEPVADERFDLIVANPPFVISPETRYTFRDAGRAGDSLSELIARTMPQYLAAGGFGHLLCNWTLPRDGDWAEPLRRWFADAGCDVVALHYMTEDPFDYAAKWLKPQCLTRPDDYGPAIDRWTEYYRAQNIGAIATGGLILRRRQAELHWFQGFGVPTHGHEPCGQQLTTLFKTQDYLRSLPAPEAMLDARLRLSPNHEVHQTLVPDVSAYRMSECRLVRTHGLPFRGNIDVPSLNLLVGCDGQRTLRQLVEQLAQTVGLPFAEVAPSCLATLRNLMLMGFLETVESAPKL